LARPVAALNRLTGLFAGFDAGHFDLPEDAKTARSAFLAVLDADQRSRSAAARLDPRVLEQQAMAAVFDAAEAGEPIFDPEHPPAWTADLLRAREEQERREAEARVLRQATEQAGDRLLGTVGDLAEVTITDYLRPAFEEVVEQAARLRDRASGLTWDHPERVISMPSAARAAWDSMTQASARYRALREAQDALWRTTEGVDTGLWRFMDMRSPYAIWPSRGSWQESAPPWPSDPRARLLWLVERREEAGLWMPTPDEARAASASPRSRFRTPAQSSG
jgi:hypothetical protein